MSPLEIVIRAVVAGLVASVACGLGVLPLFIPGLDPAKHRGLAYAMAGGLMFSASVYNLILPALDMGDAGWSLQEVLPIIGGFFLGALFLSIVELRMHNRELQASRHAQAPSSKWGGRVGLLVFLAMTFHSIPEGVAVGVGYTSQELGLVGGQLGTVLALAIAIHNIPEGLAVGIPMRAAGASFGRCFAAAFLTSLPQPIAAVPAVLLAWFFKPLMPLLMGFAAGAMIFLVVLELIPDALDIESPQRIAWAFSVGFCLMLLVQVIL
jgi:ZIP family zinc transporter